MKQNKYAFNVKQMLKSYLNWATDEAKQLCLERETNAQLDY